MEKAIGIRKAFYLDTVERLKLIVTDDGHPVIRMFDLWNEQWQFIDKIPAFAFPAVFIGFKQLQWTQLGKHRQSCDALIDIHVGSYSMSETKNGSVNQEKGLAHLELLDAIHYWLSGWDKCGDYFGAMTRVNSDFDHNHNAIVAHVETYKVRLVDDSAVRSLTLIQGDLMKLTLSR